MAIVLKQHQIVNDGKDADAGGVISHVYCSRVVENCDCWYCDKFIWTRLSKSLQSHFYMAR